MNLEKEIFDISLNDIIPNRFQPREMFDDTALQELAQSIKEHGVIQPIIVRKVGDKYEIIAGERRFRASQLAGKKTVPALVRDIDDKEAAKIALLENLQRSNLTPIEEAKTYQTILKLDNITQEELAQNLGKSQSTIANKLRLLTLDEEVQTALLNSQISERHARSLLSLDYQRQVELLHRIINEKLTVRQVDEEVMRMTGKITDEPVTQNEVVPNPQEGRISMDIAQNPVVSSSFNNQIQEPVQTQVPVNNQENMNFINNQTPGMVQNQEIYSQNNNPDLMANYQNTTPEVVQPMTPGFNEIQNNQMVDIPQINQNINPDSQNQLIEPIVEVPTVEPQNDIVDSENNFEIPNQIMPEPIEQNIPTNDIQGVNQAEELPKTNIFDKLRVQETNDNEQITPEVSPIDEIKQPENNQTVAPAIIGTSTIINSEQPEIAPDEFGNIYDLRFAINNFRQAIQNTEKFGFKVTANEYDSENKYQIVIEIDKKN